MFINAIYFLIVQVYRNEALSLSAAIVIGILSGCASPNDISPNDVSQPQAIVSTTQATTTVPTSTPGPTQATTTTAPAAPVVVQPVVCTTSAGVSYANGSLLNCYCGHTSQCTTTNLQSNPGAVVNTFTCTNGAWIAAPNNFDLCSP